LIGKVACDVAVAGATTAADIPAIPSVLGDVTGHNVPVTALWPMLMLPVASVGS